MACLSTVTRPVVPSTSTSSPSEMTIVARPTAVTVGTPYSRPTMAACDRVPPPSHTQAAILAKAGVQFGEVDSQTSTSPGLSRCSSSALCRTRAGPRPVPLEAGTPVSVLTCPPEPTASTARRKWLFSPKISIRIGSLTDSGMVPTTLGRDGRRSSQ